MNEETAGADTPAADGAQPEALVEISETTTAEQSTTDSVADQADPETGDDTAAQPKKKHWAHERIDELTRNWREAQRRAEKAEQKLAQSQNVKLDDLEYEDQIAERTIQRSRQETAETERETASELAFEVYGARVAAATEKYPDYEAVAHHGWQPTETMRDLILESEVGPDIAYHLGKNRTEAARIAALPVHRQAAEMGKLEVRLSAPKPVPKQPPAPVSPVGGSASGGSVDPSKMSMAEYVAAREAGKI